MKFPQPTCATCRFWDLNTQRIGTYKGGQSELRVCIATPQGTSKLASDYCGLHPDFVTANPRDHDGQETLPAM